VGFSVRQTTDGGYVVTGYTKSFGAGTPDNTNVYLIRTTAFGDTLWTRVYGGSKDDGDWVSDVRQTKDGGYVVATNTRSFGAGRGDVYLIKTDDAGDTLWTRTVGGSDPDWGEAVQQTSDGGYVVFGTTWCFGGDPDVYLVRTDSAGDTLWTRSYGGSYNDWGNSGQLTADGGYVIVGAVMYVVYLVRVDASGEVMWTRTYGGFQEDGYSIQQTADGGYIIAGYTDSFGSGARDVYLIKTDTLGNVGVAEQDPGVPVHGLTRAATFICSLPADVFAFDAMGRRVVNPRSGIYFVRDEGRGAGGAGRTRKVVLQR
jgi:hypothetical protein